MDATILAKYRLTGADYRRVLFWHQWKRTAITIGITILVVFFAGISFVKPTEMEPYKRLPIYLAIAIIPIFVTFGFYRGILRRAKKLEKISDETRSAFTNEGLEFVTALSSSSVKWERFNKIVEIGDYFVFFPQDDVFFIVPKRGFENTKSINDLKSIFKDKLGDKAKLRI